MSAIYVQIRRVPIIYTKALFQKPARYSTSMWYPFSLFFKRIEPFHLLPRLIQSNKYLLSIYKKFTHFHLVTPNIVVL
jgi:hypothetical protein